MHLGLIGFGNIGAGLMQCMRDDPGLSDVPVTALVRPGRDAPCKTVNTVGDLLAEAPTLIVEAAGHGAVRDHAPACLEAGIDAVVASIGALADADLQDRLLKAARIGNARLILPAGAIGGIDLLSALRVSGITAVTYEGRKPPVAWKGSPAEEACDLDGLQEKTVFFQGSARDAALAYPKNANVAATIAVAGIGFDETEVRLIADPDAAGNTHRFTVTSGGADFGIEISGKPSPDNPRTSMATVYSLLREVRNRVEPVAI